MQSPSSLRFYTIGYQGKSMDEFLKGLQEAEVRTVVDVRAMPVSRRKGFSKTTLMRALEKEGIAYIGVPELGVARSLRERYQGCDLTEFEPEYHRIVLGNSEERVAEMVRLVASGSVCLLCYEQDAAECHRSLLSSALVQRIGGKADVIHL